MDEAERALDQIIPLASIDRSGATRSVDRVREILQQLRSAGTQRDEGAAPLLGNDIE